MSRRQSVMRSRTSLKRALLRPHVLGPGLELLGARHQRAEIETERHFDRPAPPFAGEALAVRAVAPNDEAAIDQGRQMPPQRRRRHAVGAQSELLVRREDDQARRRSAWSRDESSATRREPPTRARTRRSWPWRCRSRGTPATCARPCQAAALSPSPGSPHGQASAIAAQRASLKREIACLRLQLGKEKSITETALGSNRTLDSDSRK